MAMVVTVSVPRRISVDVDFGPCYSRALCSGAGIWTSSGTTRTPAVPDIIPFGTVMDEDEEAEGDGKGTIKAAEDHVEEVAL